MDHWTNQERLGELVTKKRAPQLTAPRRPITSTFGFRK
jgi:hypothetical protein